LGVHLQEKRQEQRTKKNLKAGLKGCLELMERDADDHLADMAGEGGLPEQRCETVTIFYGSGSDF
jgi:hypothetical protein